MFKDPTTLEEAMQNTYGTPAFQKDYQKGRCAYEVITTKEGGLVRLRQCKRKNGKGVGGLYCAVHAIKIK